MFRKVAADAEKYGKELIAVLKKRMVEQKDEAAECIQMVRKLGEPIESLQARYPSKDLLKDSGMIFSICSDGSGFGFESWSASFKL